MRILAGGPGSGCNPKAGQCGRTPGVKKSLIQQSHKLPGGGRYTIAKPVTRGRPPGQKNKASKGGTSKPHQQTGQFKKVVKKDFVIGLKSGRAEVYDANRTKALWSRAKAGEGTTVIAIKDLEKKKATIREYSRGEFGYLRSGGTRVTKFNNLGRADGYLSQRFGIGKKKKKD